MLGLFPVPCRGRTVRELSLASQCPQCGILNIHLKFQTEQIM